MTWKNQFLAPTQIDFLESVALLGFIGFDSILIHVWLGSDLDPAWDDFDRVSKVSQSGKLPDFWTMVNAGMELSPRMDIAELGCNYAMIVELPGVSIKDIRVEVDDQK